MKKVLLATCLMFGLAYGQDVPEKVESKLSEKYPAAESVRWKEVGEYFEASFFNDDLFMNVRIDDAGEIIQTTTSIDEEDIPAPIAEKVSGTYEDFVVEGVSKIETKDGTIKYELILSGDVSEIVIQFDKSGKVLGKSVTEY